MSAFVCSDRHIATIAQAYTLLAGGSSAEAKYLADLLKRENIRSVNYRCRCEFSKPDSFIKYWGQGFLRQNIERFVRDYWDRHEALPAGIHPVGAHKIDFGREA